MTTTNPFKLSLEIGQLGFCGYTSTAIATASLHCLLLFATSATSFCRASLCHSSCRRETGTVFEALDATACVSPLPGSAPPSDCCLQQLLASTLPMAGLALACRQGRSWLAADGCLLQQHSVSRASIPAARSQPNCRAALLAPLLWFSAGV